MAYRWVWESDGEGIAITVTSVSEAAAALTGHAAAGLVAGGHAAYLELIHPDERHRYRRAIFAALHAGEAYEVAYRIWTASGDEKWVWDQGRAVGTADSGGQVVVGLVMDITSRPALEHRYGAADRTFRALFEQASDVIFLIRDGVFIDCNPRTEAIFHSAREEVVGRTPAAFSPVHQPDGRTSAEAARARIELAMAGVPQRFDWKHQRADGEVFDAEVSLTRVDLDDGPALLGIVRDVTERAEVFAQLERRVEASVAELETIEARYRSLFERSRDAVFIATRVHFVDVNQAALELLGVSREEVIGAHVDTFLVEGERERINQAGLLTDGFVKDFEIKVLRKDGEVRDCLLTGHDYVLNAESLGFEGVLRDITEFKRTEEELFEQTRESAVLDERNRIAREIHDTIAQGLTGIVLQLEAAEQAQETGSTEAEAHLSRAKSLARESLQEARRSVWNLVPQVLQDGNLADAIERDVRRFRAGGSSEVVFTVTGEPRPLSGGIDVALLRICQEALMNVRKYAQAREVHISLDYQDEAVRLAVADDGIGFELNHASTDDTGRGGFGLTSMAQRAHQVGGTFSVTSAPKAGTRVEVTVPLSPVATSTSQPVGGDR